MNLLRTSCRFIKLSRVLFVQTPVESSAVCERVLNWQSIRRLTTDNKDNSGHFKSTEALSSSVSSTTTTTTSTAVNAQAIPSESRRNKYLNRYLTIPNCLTTSRILMTPIISYLMITHSHDYAFYAFIVASITDFADGYIARRFPNQQSFIGSILDPLADKLLIGTLTVTLGYCAMLPHALVAIILLRDVLLMAGTIYLNKANVKFLDFNIKPSNLSKFNTFVQLSLITLTIPSELYAYSGSAYLGLLQYLTAFTTIASGLAYARNHGYKKI
jgi:cardiolipin synthase